MTAAGVEELAQDQARRILAVLDRYVAAQPNRSLTIGHAGNVWCVSTDRTAFYGESLQDALAQCSQAVTYTERAPEELYETE